MKLVSNYDIGQKVWCIVNDGRAVKELTVGQVRMIYTDSPGREGETTFDNYMPQKSYQEQYMCIETGIGSGSVFELGRNIFSTEALAWAKLSTG